MGRREAGQAPLSSLLAWEPRLWPHGDNRSQWPGLALGLEAAWGPPAHGACPALHGDHGTSSLCAVQRSSHRPRVAVEPLKRGSCGGRPELQLYSLLLTLNQNWWRGARAPCGTLWVWNEARAARGPLARSLCLDQIFPRTLKITLKKKRGIMQRRTPRAASSVRAADRLSDVSICPGDAARGERKLLDASLFLTVYLQLHETSRNEPATSERRHPPCPPPVRRPAPPRAPPTAARVGVEVPGRGPSGRRAFPAVPLGLGVAAARAAGRARVAGGLAAARAAGPTRWPLPEQRRPLVAGTRVPR